MAETGEIVIELGRTLGFYFDHTIEEGKRVPHFYIGIDEIGSIFITREEASAIRDLLSIFIAESYKNTNSGKVY